MKRTSAIGLSVLVTLSISVAANATVSLSTLPLSSGDFQAPAGTIMTPSIFNPTQNPGTSTSERDIKQDRDNAQTFQVDASDFPMGVNVDKVFIYYEQGGFPDQGTPFDWRFFSVADPTNGTLTEGTVHENATNLTFPGGSPTEGTAVFDIDDMVLPAGSSYGIKFDTESADPKIVKWSRNDNWVGTGSRYESDSDEGSSDYTFGIVGTPVLAAGPIQSTGFPAAPENALFESRVRTSQELDRSSGNQGGQDLLLIPNGNQSLQDGFESPGFFFQSGETYNYELTFDDSTGTFGTTVTRQSDGAVLGGTHTHPDLGNPGFQLTDLQIRTKTNGNDSSDFEMEVLNLLLSQGATNVPIGSYDTADSPERFTRFDVTSIESALGPGDFTLTGQFIPTAMTTTTSDELLNLEVLVGGIPGVAPGSFPNKLLIDIGPSGQDVEEGAFPFPSLGTAPSDGANGTDFSEVIMVNGNPVTVSIDDTDQSGSDEGGIDWRDRGDSTNSMQELVDLGEDFVKNNSGVIRLTLEGLPAGEYMATSFHEDSDFDQSDMIEVLINSDGMGFVSAGILGFDQDVGGVDNLTTAIMEAGAANFMFTALDGVPVILVFDGRPSGDNETPLNGLRLMRVLTVPEPATAGLLGLAGLALLRRRRAA